MCLFFRDINTTIKNELNSQLITNILQKSTLYADCWIVFFLFIYLFLALISPEKIKKNSLQLYKKLVMMFFFFFY